MFRTRFFLPVAAILCAMASFTGSASAASATGDLRFAQEAKSSLDRFTESPSADTQAWMRQHYDRMRTYAPYFDGRTTWYSNSWAYKDSYGVYKNEDGSPGENGRYVLKDSSGNKMFIPFGCGGGTCPLYAADIGDPGFRAAWIADLRQTMRGANYKGVFVDDVNMEFRVSDGNGDERAPVNPRTGHAMTHAEWKGYMATFMEEIRAAFPDKEIVHNAIWYSGHDDPDVARELRSADVINLERGVVDGGLSRGGGTFGVETFLKHVEWLHRNGKAVTYDAYASTRDEAEYNMAAYFLTNNERDTYRSDFRSTPDDWWNGYDVKLGAAKGPRYEQDGLLRRDFENGYVLLNQPGNPTRTVATAGGRGPDGAPRNAVTLRGGSGAVVVGQLPPVVVPVLAKPVTNPVGAVLSKVLGRTSRASKTKVSKRSKAKARKIARRSVLVKGKVRQAKGRTGKVRIQVRRRHGKHWVAVRTATVNVKRGRFSKLFTGLRKGRYSAKASSLGARGAKANVSARGFAISHR
jgi:hypothetical protein